MKHATILTNIITIGLLFSALVLKLLSKDTFLSDNIQFLCYHTFIITVILYLYRKKFSHPFLLLINLFSFFSIIIGELFNFYEYLPFYDKLLHGYSGFIIAFFTYSFTSYVGDKKIQLLLSFCVAITCSSLWEVFEFTCDQLFGANMQESFFY